jgi:hypothetical protein
MNKAIVLLLCMCLVACGSPRVLEVDGVRKEYPTYGFFNASSKESQKVCYEVSIGNVVWTGLDNNNG